MLVKTRAAFSDFSSHNLNSCLIDLNAKNFLSFSLVESKSFQWWGMWFHDGHRYHYLQKSVMAVTKPHASWQRSIPLKVSNDLHETSHLGTEIRRYFQSQRWLSRNLAPCHWIFHGDHKMRSIQCMRYSHEKYCQIQCWLIITIKQNMRWSRSKLGTFGSPSQNSN